MESKEKALSLENKGETKLTDEEALFYIFCGFTNKVNYDEEYTDPLLLFLFNKIKLDLYEIIETNEKLKKSTDDFIERIRYMIKIEICKNLLNYKGLGENLPKYDCTFYVHRNQYVGYEEFSKTVNSIPLPERKYFLYSAFRFYIRDSDRNIETSWLEELQSYLPFYKKVSAVLAHYMYKYANKYTAFQILSPLVGNDYIELREAIDSLHYVTSDNSGKYRDMFNEFMIDYLFTENKKLREIIENDMVYRYNGSGMKEAEEDFKNCVDKQC